MKISLNTVLLMAILALAVWYLFFKPVPVAPVVEQTTAPVQEPTTIIKEIIKVISRPVVPTYAKQVVAPSNPTLEKYSGKVNWKGR